MRYQEFLCNNTRARYGGSFDVLLTKIDQLWHELEQKLFWGSNFVTDLSF